MTPSFTSTERSHWASRINGDDIGAEALDDNVAQYLTYIIHGKSGKKKDSKWPKTGGKFNKRILHTKTGYV